MVTTGLSRPFFKYESICLLKNRHVVICLLIGILSLMIFSTADAAGTLLNDVELHDVTVTDQNGTMLKFESEIVGDRIAVVIPFYTTCTTAYPILIHTFTRLQNMLADKLGKEVVLVSVSVEPKIDTPIRMKAYARRQKARPEWIFLTGEKNDLEKMLYGIRLLPSENLVEHNHNPITIVGGVKHEWRRYHGFPSPELLQAEINEIMVE